MNNNHYVNHCIACDVTECKNHHQTQDFCSLEAIKVGTHEKNPQVPPCTDCQSFEPQAQA